MDLFLEKAEESLAGAESELANGRFDNCANRCYYACFQAAIWALIKAGMQPRSQPAHWGHDFVQAEFIGQLINRRKVYPTTIRDALERNYALRQAGDYKAEHVSETQASRAMRRARQLVETIKQGSQTQ